MALAVPLSRFTSRVGGGSAFFVRQQVSFMAIRIMAFIFGAVFGAVGAIVAFWLQHSEIWWSIVGLAALVMGVLAALFGRKFLDTAISIWPS